jgi:cobalamin biosynthetic protein CobC
MAEAADHGGGLDAAARLFGGVRADWLDLSTGINPCPYPIGALPKDAWTALPDSNAFAALELAARAFWQVPTGAAVLAAPGASALIARMPLLAAAGRVAIAAPTYNEHGRAFRSAGWQVVDAESISEARVLVHPNNPDGRVWGAQDLAGLTIVDESFCDVMPEASLMRHAAQPGIIILKSFGKFWGLAGMRLGFAIGDPALIARLSQAIGPWAVSGPALAIGAQALRDVAWAQAERVRLACDAKRLDALIAAPLVGGTTLFRLYDVGDALAFQTHLASVKIWSRVFPYSTRWVRLGLPGAEADWSRLEAALQGKTT